MSDSVTVARNDLALRIGMDVLGLSPDGGRITELAYWMGNEGTDLGQATARLIATTRRAALIEAAEMCEGEARAWDVVGLLDYARPLTAMAARLRALADQPTPPASREGASNA